MCWTLKPGKATPQCEVGAVPVQVVAYVAERAEAARAAGVPDVLWDVLRVLAAHGSFRASAKQGRGKEQDSPGLRGWEPVTYCSRVLGFKSGYENPMPRNTIVP